jgi:hypothetical protein
MSTGVLQIPYEHLITSNKWKEKDELIKWALANYVPKFSDSKVHHLDYMHKVEDNPLANWIDTYIQDKKMSFSSEIVATSAHTDELTKLLAKRKIPLRFWRKLMLLYMNQFFAKVLQGKDNRCAVLYKGIDNDGTPKPIYISFMDLKKIFNLKRQFTVEEIEEGKDDDDEGELEFDENDKIVNKKKRKRTEEKKKKKKSKKKSKKAKHHHHHQKEKSTVVIREGEKERTVEVTMNPLRAAINKIAQVSSEELPVIVNEEGEDEEGDPVDDDGGEETSSKKRVKISAASLFENDPNHRMTILYEIISSKPCCDMISYYDENEKVHCLVHDPSAIDDAGHKLIRDFFARHNSDYRVPIPKELNTWKPFSIRFGDLRVQNICQGRVGKAAWDKGLKEACDKANLLWNHLYAVLCAKNEESFKTLLTWMASLIQRPWENSNITINHQGPQGIGKSEVMSPIIV